MRKIGLLAVGLLVVLALAFGAIAGAIVGSLTASSHGTGGTTDLTSNVAAQSSVDKVVPVTNAVNVVSRVGPAVVTIIHQLPTTYDFFGNPQPGGTALGSGFIVDRKGDIVTNAHVVSGATHFTVIFANGKKTSGTLVGANSLNDVAVVHVNGRVPAVAQFGNSSLVKPGEPVIAIGNALGQFQNTVTEGIISGLHRTLSGLTSQNMIQTDAAINHGNSGGPLLDLTGRVIGMNTAIDRSAGQSTSNPFGVTDPNATVAEGLGFAIPSNTVAEIAQHIINHIPAAYLGVYYQSVSSVARAYGVPGGASIQRVTAGSPAARAGLTKHDIILSVDGLRVNDASPLEDLIAPHKPGDVVKLKIWRSGKTLTIHVTLGSQPNK